jgi:uncharacterized protein with PIN domain
MAREMTPSEQEDLTVALVRADVLRQGDNAVVCPVCGESIERLPRSEMFRRCVFVSSEPCQVCGESGTIGA